MFDSTFWEQLSVFFVLSGRGRLRFRKLKRASRLKVFFTAGLEVVLVVEVALLLLLLRFMLLVAGELSRSPSAPSARSPAAAENVTDVKFLRQILVANCVNYILTLI